MRLKKTWWFHKKKSDKYVKYICLGFVSVLSEYDVILLHQFEQLIYQHTWFAYDQWLIHRITHIDCIIDQ